MTKVLIIISFKIRYNFQVIQCLKCLTNNYKTLVIASIHQPNNDILMNFDSIHVLSKGGLCLYWGSPKDIKNYLMASNITCHDFQVPIEVITKIATNESNEKRIIDLCDRNYCENSSRISEIKINVKFFVNSLKFNSKWFRLNDFFNLSLLTINNNYISKPGSVLIQFLLFAAMNYCLTKCYNSNMGQIDGCFDLETYLDMSCEEVEENRNLIEYNLMFLFSSSIILIVSMAAIYTSAFIKDFKAYTSEHRNRKKFSRI